MALGDPMHLLHVAIFEHGERLQRRLRTEVKGVLRKHLHLVAVRDAEARLTLRGGTLAE